MFSIVFQLFEWLFSKHSRNSNKAEPADADDLSIGLDALHGVLRSLKTAS